MWLTGLYELHCRLAAEEWVQVMPPQLTVLELPADSEPTPALLAACRKLKAKGIRLALHDYSGKPESEPLVSLADYIKVSILKQNAAERIELLSKLSASAAHLVAEHVETPEEFNQVRDEGFTLFQGYYFCHPEPVKNHKIPATAWCTWKSWRPCRTNLPTWSG